MAKVDVFLVDRIDFKLKMVKRGRENHYIMVKRSVYQANIANVNILEWVAISFSRGSSPPMDQTWVSFIADRCFNL